MAQAKEKPENEWDGQDNFHAVLYDLKAKDRRCNGDGKTGGIVSDKSFAEVERLEVNNHCADEEQQAQQHEKSDVAVVCNGQKDYENNHP